MTALHLGPRGPIGPLANGGFEVSYVPDDAAEHRVPITQAAWAVPLERVSVDYAAQRAGAAPRPKQR